MWFDVKLKVMYYAPFDKMVEVKSEVVELKGSCIKLSDLMKFLSESRGLSEFISLESDEDSRRHMIVVVDSKLARLDDEIHDGCVVKLLPPLAGG